MKINPLKRVAAFAICFWAALPTTARAQQHTVQSPNGQINLILNITPDGATYTVQRRGESLVDASRISLFGDAKYSVIEKYEEKIDHVWYPVWGPDHAVHDLCNQLTIQLKASDLRVDLICQVYDDGLGIRFKAPADAGWRDKSLAFLVECAASDDYQAYAPQGERAPLGPLRLSQMSKRKARRISQPVVMDTGKGTWMAMLGSDLYSAKGFETGFFRVDKQSSTLQFTSEGHGSPDGFVTPWRAILIGDTPGDLLDSKVALNLAAPCAVDDTSWIKAGKGLWDWRIHGYDNGDFVYGINTRSYLRIIDFAAEQGITYFTIDAHWYIPDEQGRLIPTPKVEMETVIAHAKEKGVQIILYYDRKRRQKRPVISDTEMLNTYQSLGATGLKYGFMGPDATFTRGSIDASAERELIIFHHDNPAPMAGIQRTMPNLITREYCHAQQDSRRAFTPTDFLKMAMINALVGPMDQANGNFGINSINAGERNKGPKKKNTYVSTVVSEISRCAVISSGLITLPDAPEEYLKKEDLFQFLKAMPATWDHSHVVNSKMAEYITTARRTGDTWFVASVNNEMPRALDINLDFLTPGTVYEATLFEDAADAHGATNPESYRISSALLKASDTLSATMAHGGGHAMILRPVGHD